ncbi:ribonuclease P protein subunit Rpr2p [Monosporozyma servazzii]
MAKKQQRIDENGTLLIDPPKQVGANKENYQRINYLYQLATFSNIINNDISMARMYNKNLDLIAKKVKCQISPNIKRNICKKCNRSLIPSRTCQIKIKNKSKFKTLKNDDLVVECQCGQLKVFRIGLQRDYNPFHERNLIQMAHGKDNSKKPSSNGPLQR